jgi:hypothetical protein
MSPSERQLAYIRALYGRELPVGSRRETSQFIDLAKERLRCEALDFHYRS